MSGDKTKGLRYAKGARMRGMYAEHRAWGGRSVLLSAQEGVRVHCQCQR